MSTLDAEIATLAREAPHDPLARYRWRCALVRAGRGAEAGFEEGDEVSVSHHYDEHEGGIEAVSNPAFEGVFSHGHVTPNRDLYPSLLARCSHRSAWTLLTPAKPKGVAT